MTKRADGRRTDELRAIAIHRNYIQYPQGSCLIEMGGTKVICTASIEKTVPQFLKNTQTGWITAEYRMLPGSCENRIPRDKTSARSMEIQRLIGRALRSVVNTKKLGERTIWIDCDVIQADGGTRTASIIGGFCALVDCVSTLYQRREIPEMCITDLIGAVSVGLWQGTPVLDLTYGEDSKAEVDTNIVMKASGEFIEIQGTAERGSFSEQDLHAFLTLAKKGIEKIIAIERDLFKDVIRNM